MSIRRALAFALVTAAALAPAASADAAIQKWCVRPYGSAVPGAVQKTYCVGTDSNPGGCTNVAVMDPRGGGALAGLDICKA